MNHLLSNLDTLTQLQKIADHLNLSISEIVSKEIRPISEKEVCNWLLQDEESISTVDTKKFIEDHLYHQTIYKFDESDRYYRFYDVKNFVSTQSSLHLNEIWMDPSYETDCPF